ncbi:hypothetical protein J7T55_008596 [Diaporthe amygdali]|uniref:uncharacterized protein n=1 Tax=Phomopsis amygdali TaxID=1214568 RepID=UPI0022FDBE8D|nr:uncharacterized protein J7T55_008596 [Diaporthe amygdali]KAJ0121432.1 hypothetical protein J7T55_008596 [Diaporthe amygdali]
MTPTRRTKGSSGESASAADQVEIAQSAPEQGIATIPGSSSAAQESPRKKQRTGISMNQKQALIDNLQLEISERARKLRAQYNLQAQGLRTRIEIRVNRIPMALRKSKMGDLADKHQNELEQPKKRTRAQPPQGESTKASRVLSPASSNIRTLPRTTPGGKAAMTRPGLNTVAGASSPVKQHSSSNLFSNLAEKARSTRTAAAGRKQTASTSTTASSAGGSARGRKAAQGAGATTSATASKTARRVSGISESSESSTSTVVKKGSARAAQDATKDTAPAPSTKRTVMGTIRRGMTGTGATKKAAAAKSTKTPASAATGRVLRNRS